MAGKLISQAQESTLTQNDMIPLARPGDTTARRYIFDGSLMLVDGITAPAARTGYAIIYVDSSGGDLKIIFGDGTVKTIVTDT